MRDRVPPVHNPAAQGQPAQDAQIAARRRRQDFLREWVQQTFPGARHRYQTRFPPESNGYSISPRQTICINPALPGSTGAVQPTHGRHQLTKEDGVRRPITADVTVYRWLVDHAPARSGGGGGAHAGGVDHYLLRTPADSHERSELYASITGLYRALFYPRAVRP